MDLELHNVSFQLADKEILHDISLDVARGEYVGILGPNGSGKSTVLKNIYRVLKPTAGEVLLFQKNVQDMTLQEAARTLSVVGQFHRVNFDFTVWEMVAMGRIPHLKGMGKLKGEDKEKIRTALSKVGMAGCENRSFASLSGGEQQRVILARAVVQEPRFLLLDEPTNHLDIRHQIQLMELTKRLKIGVLAVLHDLNLASMYCDRIYILKEGNILAQGEPLKILTPELISEVYGVSCRIVYDGARPIVIYDRGAVPCGA